MALCACVAVPFLGYGCTFAAVHFSAGEYACVGVPSDGVPLAAVELGHLYLLEDGFARGPGSSGWAVAFGPCDLGCAVCAYASDVAVDSEGSSCADVAE